MGDTVIITADIRKSTPSCVPGKFSLQPALCRQCVPQEPGQTAAVSAGRAPVSEVSPSGHVTPKWLSARQKAAGAVTSQTLTNACCAVTGRPSPPPTISAQLTPALAQKGLGVRVTDGQSPYRLHKWWAR
ncbi:hypothetical protein BaRGS_00033935 [Batillaria attramentaria]|uniref:Uncharacterized protein n=1 Tax=Batillaria attramentaria TaxID=370345 RepID=A0ABD0JIR8_9CAEN